MDDKERVRLLLERVMGYFVTDVTTTGWRSPELPRGRQAPAGFHWPIAFWNTDGECWMIKDIATDPTIFDPLHDLNDAWQVLCRVAHLETADKEELTYALFGTTWGDLSTFQTIDILCAWTPETICRAALAAVGITDLL